MNQIQILRMKAFSDNYIWGIVSLYNRAIYVVDPGESAPVESALQKYNLNLKGILITHHHHDHIGGVDELCKQNPSIQVFGPQGVHSLINVPVAEGDIVNLKDIGLKLAVYEIPGHTASHIAYTGHQMLFCGDTLFSLGCGRVFDGTVEALEKSLTMLAMLDDDTVVYCAHEYTKNNLEFALSLGGDIYEPAEERVEMLNKADLSTVPSPLLFEKNQNPFLLALNNDLSPKFQALLNQDKSCKDSVFTTLRNLKNNF